MQGAQRLIVKKFMRRVSHGNPQSHSLNPESVGGTDTLPSGNADYVCHYDTPNYTTIRTESQI